jgi:mercuric ion binding protein
MRTLALISAFTVVLLSAPFANAAETSVTLKINGMTCAACPFIVKKSLTRVDGVKTVKVSFKEKKAWVVFDDQQTTLAELTSATKSSGFPSERID